MENVSSNKRFRDDLDGPPEAKRLRADLLLDILDDDTDSGDRDPAVQDLASVMRILEEEIALPTSRTPPGAEEPAADQDHLCQPDLGYLLEASDDELGLPPPFPSSSDEGGDPEEKFVEGGGFGHVWGFYDDIPGCYDGLELGFRPEESELAGCGEEVVVFDAGLFDYADGLCGPSDFFDSSWRMGSMPSI